MGESTRDYMARTDPVGYQDCIDAGRFPPVIDFDLVRDEAEEAAPPRSHWCRHLRDFEDCTICADNPEDAA